MAPAKKSAAKKAPAKKSPAKKAPAKKAPAKKAPVKKAPVKKAPAKKAPVKKASAKKKTGSPFDKKFLSEQKEALFSEREVLSGQAAALLAEAESLAMEREPGDVQFDEESGEGDSVAVERDFDLARAAAAMRQIEEIDAALVRMEQGTYGVCESSDLPIPKERLRAIPWARQRVEYKTSRFH